MKTAIPMTLAILLASAASAQPKAPAANNPQDLVNLEAAWSKAMVARDAAALNRIVAPDWSGHNPQGQMMNRAQMIQREIAGPEKLTAMANHDVHVRFIGADHAIVQGMDDESGVTKGKAVNEVYSWTDIFAKRDGRWVAIASQVSKVK